MKKGDKFASVINDLKENPANVVEAMDKKELSELLDYLLDSYHNKGISLVSDQLFDYVNEYYQEKYKPKDKSVGAVIKGKEKVKLPYYMGSLDKVKPSTTEFEKWIDKYTGPYVLSYKLDGISALIHKKDNKISMYTRGNGTYGQDISHILEHINIDTSKIVNNDAIRGELVISKKNFKKIETVMANARNAVSGIINTKKPDVNMLKLIDFVAYWVIEPKLKQSDQLKYIENKSIKCVDYTIKKSINMKLLSEMLIKGRTDLEYEIDGVVIIDNSKINIQIEGENPDWGVAFKQVLTDQIAEATVVDVIWEISKDKYIKPKIKINTVELLGSEITFATAFNAKYVVDNKIGPGSIIKLIKSGDVIPYIQEVLKESDSKKPKMPSIKYEWNETAVDIIAIELDDESMNKIIVKKLTYFFQTLDVKYMGEGTVEKFVDNGYDDLWKILSADINKLGKIDGFGDKLIEKIYDSINKSLINKNLCDLMAASQIFGRGIGSKKFKLITDAYPNILDIVNKNGNVKEIINNISGFDDKTTTKIVDNFKLFINWLEKLIKLKPNVLYKDAKEGKSSNKEGKSSNKESKSSNKGDGKKGDDGKYSKYANKTIVFTGFRDKEVEDLLDKIGSKVTTSISKNTDILIAADTTEKSSKIVKANELNVKIISKDEFYKSLSL
jgi:NAD-dependent DNA ligase